MPGFSRHEGRLAVYCEDQVDTDRIIPARFLTMVTRSGYGDLLFRDVRGPDFPLDQPEAAGASILVVGSNFGCGSSREHAVWSIQQAGFVAVVGRKTSESEGFSDIFRQNSANCGLLLIELDQASHDRLAAHGSGAQATIDLEAQTISCQGQVERFDIAPATKKQILEGKDLIGTTLESEPKIEQFEASWSSFVPKQG